MTDGRALDAPVAGGRAASGAVSVWWAEAGPVTDAERALLSDVERERLDRYRSESAARAFVAATVLLRRRAGELLDRHPATVHIDRTCTCGQPHGRPRLPQAPGLHASISHTGGGSDGAAVVGVALTTVAPVGLDIERLRDADLAGLIRHTLGDGESAAGVAEFYRYWTRKESVVKATGDGIGVGLSRVRVSPPGAAPALLGYPGRSDLAGTMADLVGRPNHAAALTVIGPVTLRITEKTV